MEIGAESTICPHPPTSLPAYWVYLGHKSGIAVWQLMTWEMVKTQDWWWPMNTRMQVDVTGAMKELRPQKAVRQLEDPSYNPALPLTSYMTWENDVIPLSFIHSIKMRHSTCSLSLPLIDNDSKISKVLPFSPKIHKHICAKSHVI